MRREPCRKGDRPIDFLKCRVVIFFVFSRLIEAELLNCDVFIVGSEAVSHSFPKLLRRVAEKGLFSSVGYLQLFPNRAEPRDLLTRRFQEVAASLRLTRGSSWIWRSRKAVFQRRSSPMGSLSPAEDALKRRVT